MRTLVLDTNIVLDVFLFADVRVGHVREALERGELRWIATAPMRDELQRVLVYPHLMRQMTARSVPAGEVIARFDGSACLCETAPAAPVRCSDEDDQKFIDLAVAHGAGLLSKDAAVLSLKKRLASFGVSVAAA